MAAFDANNPYFRTKVLTASPEELRMMLLEGAVRFLRAGRDALEARQWEKSFESLSSAKAIIMELVGALRPEVAPELCGNLQALYTYIYSLITFGSLEKNTGKLDEAIMLMEHDAETWRMLLEKLAKERAEGKAPAAAPAQAAAPAAKPGADAPAQRQRFSISA